MNKKYIIRLTTEEQKELKNLVKKGKTQAYRTILKNGKLADLLTNLKPTTNFIFDYLHLIEEDIKCYYLSC